MGETKEKINRFLWLARIVIAGVMLFVGIIAVAQFVIYPDATVRFVTGVGAQQLADVKVKRGGNLDEMPVPLKPGAYFKGWSMTPDGEEMVTHLDRLTENVTVYAVWDGVEKYVVLMVNGVPYDEFPIFKASSDGLTPGELNARWVLPDDEHNDGGPDVIKVADSTGKTVSVVSKNNYSKFLGWQYYNVDGRIDQLLYDNGAWTLRTADGQSTPITDENLFYPPNYKTTFSAILEYRKIKLLFRNRGTNGEVVAGPITTSVTDTVTAPEYNPKTNTSTHFSHWEIIPGDLWRYVENVPEIREQINVPSFVPGERIVANHLWFYFGNEEHISVDANNGVVVTLEFRAAEWEDEKVDKYTVQIVSNTSSGVTKAPIPELTSVTELSLAQPICYFDNALWLYKDPDGQINSYNFVDHEGVIHDLPTSVLRNAQTRIDLTGDSNRCFTYSISGQDKTVIFNPERGINIAVNYLSAANTIKLSYDYGNGLYSLPDYTYNPSQVVLERNNMRIGSVEILPNAERYLKNGWLFYGWRNKVDGKIYFAGEAYTIPNFQGRLIEFVAEWREARFLFEFDLNGGDWGAVTPDFSMMKGAYGDYVSITWNVPVRYGYNFIGWELNGQTRQPGDFIEVSEKIELLRAIWEPKKVTITFYYLVTETNRHPQVVDGYYFGDNVRLVYGYSTSKNYYFNGWLVGKQLYQPEDIIELNYENVILLNPQERNGELYIEIWADQSIAQAKITYKDDVFAKKQVEMGWVTAITQGERFFDYRPFSLSNREMDLNGQEFSGWEYSISSNVNAERWRITATTVVKPGVEEIFVYAYASYQPKSFYVEFRGFQGEVYCKVHHRFETVPCGEDGYEFYTYDSTPVSLLMPNDVQASLPLQNPTWGQFVGWSFEQDRAAGNPDVIYNVLNKSGVQLLQLSNVDDAVSSVYKIDVDRHTEKIGDVETDQEIRRLVYKLTLYAVYAQNFVNITYQGLQASPFQTPVFSGDDRTTSVLGGTTVGPEHDSFTEYGLSVFDEYGLQIPWLHSFVGWRLTVQDGVAPALKELLENKIWFPGEYLPAVDFDLTFEPIFAPQGVLSPAEAGNAKYTVMALSVTDGTVASQIINDVDIVVFPSGDYVVPTGSITINGPVQRVVFPASGAITLEPMAISADGLTSFYVSDNLQISASPVVGAKLESYRVKKGYRTWNQASGTYSSILSQTMYYDPAAARLGLLVRNDGTLLAVPSGTALGTAGLRNGLLELGVTKIASYAIAQNTSLSQIDLSIDNLQIADKAIFTSNAEKIILPLSDFNRDCIAGYHYQLTAVRFGPAEAMQSDYALVENGFVYHGTDRSYLMFVLPGVINYPGVMRNLGYGVNHDLLLNPAVRGVNAYAFASRNLALIGSITADDAGQKEIDLTQLVGVNNVPLFVHAENPYLGSSLIQTYEKIFYFTYDGRTQQVTYKYGQDFVVFDPKDNNPHDFTFDKSWHRFVGWFSDTGAFYYAGDVYRVGIDSRMLVPHKIVFNADREASWKSYPIKFHIYNGRTDVEADISFFVDKYGRKYTLQQVINNPNLLSQLYLPGMDLFFVSSNGTKYQFVGWESRTNAPTGFADRLWNKESATKILPNRAENTKLDAGTKVGDVYNYYALYDMVTDNLEYTLEGVGYTVSPNTNIKATNNIYIPYAKYNKDTGFMVPVMKVAGTFKVDNITINEIVIGAAVTEIGDGAFQGVNAKVTFAHRGSSITLQFPDGTVGGVRQSFGLKIGRGAFKDNTALIRLDLPTAISEIGDEAFRGCTALTTVYLENAEASLLTRLGDFAFRDNTSMNVNAIVILITSDTVTKQRFTHIGQGVFANTNWPTNSNIVWCNTLLYASGLTDHETAVVDSTIQAIRGYAFAGISNVSTIKVENPQIKLEARAFANLDSSVQLIDLSAVRRSEATIDTNAFSGLRSGVKVKVVPTRDWSDFKGVEFV